MAASTRLPDSSSYTAMSVGDVEAIGAHCQMPFCRQLDFLPFRCESCHGTFCLDHRSETSHKCTNAGAWAARRRQQVPSTYTPTPRPSLLNHEQQCYSTSCKTLINTPLTPGIVCPTCNRSYCLKHRMKEDHDCGNVKPLGALPTQSQSQRERGLAALSKLRAWGQAQKSALSSASSTAKSKPSSTTSASSISALNNLKRTAKGDPKIPPDKRIYLHTEAEATTTTSKVPKAELYFSSDWTVGRALDVAAKSLQVQNVNNRVSGEEDKLRVFHVEGGRLLEFGEKMGDVVRNGNTLVLLRGVGPAVPDLIQS